MNISIVNFSKGPCTFNIENLKGEGSKKLKFNVLPRLRYSSSSDYVGFQMDITVMKDDLQVLQTGFLVGMHVDGWTEKLQAGIDLATNRSELKSLADTAWFVATGVVAEQTTSAETFGIILPTIDLEEFCNDIVLLPDSSGKETESVE